ncbi:MAG: hypothetical protein ABSD46_09315 [Bacteroidota bacterium]
MKKYYFHILLLFSSAFYIGCTNTYFVATHSLQTQRDTITINQLEQMLQDKTVKIILRDNQQVQAENVTFSKDTAIFTILPDLKQSSIPLVAIKKIERRLHFDGAFGGVFLGFLCGGIVGVTYGKIYTNSNGPSDDAVDGVFRIIGLGVFGGGIYGGFRGTIVEYIFDSDIDKRAP